MRSLPSGRPTRVVLNFSHHCALNCEWCYVSFDASRAQRKVVMEVVDRIVSLGFQTITFGGGDPFQYSYVGDLARHAKSSGLNVHIDTHGKSLVESQANVTLLAEAVDLIGLPLDGPTPEVHDGMRGAPGHFSLVLKRLRWLRSIGARFKINTMVSRCNVDSLPELSALVQELAPERWSVYQYMPLGPGAAVAATHLLDTSAFQSAAATAAERFSASSTVVLEVADKDSRRATYPIVRHDGSVFVHSKELPDALHPICSIFEAQAREDIDTACGPERQAALSRYTPVRILSESEASRQL